VLHCFHADSLRKNGIQFTNVWSNPTCSPTRAGIITGKYGFRTGVTAVDKELSTTETSLQKYITEKTNNDYSSSVIGKWHLSKDNNHPNNIGIDYYAGSISGSLKSYTDWTLNVNGSISKETSYNTSKYTDLAIDWVKAQDKPWFLWLAYNAPHTPFHLPPSTLHSQGSLPVDQTSIDNNPRPYYFAMIEAMDSEMGRLFKSIPEEEKKNTVVIFVGDNGTPGQVFQGENNRRAKGSLYQGGINVPMIISGNGVTRMNQVEDVLINTTDLFATISEIAGIGIKSIHDSQSFKGVLDGTQLSERQYVYSETETEKAIRDNTHKYLLFESSESLFDLVNNPLEKPDLLSENQLPLSDVNTKIKDELIEALNGI